MKHGQMRSGMSRYRLLGALEAGSAQLGGPRQRAVLAALLLRYPTPSAARADLAERYRTPAAGGQLRRFEIAVAVADGECARATRIPARVRALKTAAVGDLPADQRRALDECVWAWRRAVSVAARIRAAG